MTANPFEAGLDKCAANYEALSPLTFIEWAASVYPDRTAIIHGDRRQSWADTFDRCRRLAGALKVRGIGAGDAVSVMAPNVPALFEAHFGVPAAGAVLNALNVRLDAPSIAYMLGHAETKLLLVDAEFHAVIKDALAMLDDPPAVIDLADPLGPEAAPLGEMDYETLLAGGDPDVTWAMPDDEWRAISLNYTSGTTGDPKGVVYHHRGAYLNAIGNILTWGMGRHPVYLWTLPMFHCNGWCFPWSVTALAGTHVCLRAVEPGAVFDAIAAHGVTHMCGAPIVLGMLINAPEEQRAKLSRPIEIMTAGAAPPAAVIEKVEAMGANVTHVYGLTEVYGPAAVCAWKSEWDDLAVADRAALKARQGVRYLVEEGLMVADSDTLAPVPMDGETMGEVFFRGNIAMKGYLKNEAATEAAFRGGWFHSGDLAVRHPDGYIEIKDRLKDIIISGGENISSIEVEGALYRHPDVVEAAVVARDDEKWGESPCAFVTLRDGKSVSEQDIIGFCREMLAHFKCPKTVIFGPLPKTSTGKIQKFLLREQARAMGPVPNA